MTLTLSAPSKTFLVGEYLALEGGPALILATGPRFELSVRQGPSARNPFHPDSPAGKWWAQREPLHQWDFEFRRPAQGAGFGGSTAEFLLLSALDQMASHLDFDSQLDLDLKETLKTYRTVATQGAKVPSGADLVGQYQGFVTAFDRRAGRIENFNWGFKNLKFEIFRTGEKLPTHEHLQVLAESDFVELEGPAQQVWEAFRTGSESHLVFGVVEYQAQLARRGLQAAKTVAWTQELRKQSGVRAVKGCGALGVDAILVIYDAREMNRAEVLKVGSRLGLSSQSSEQDLAPGLRKEPNLP